MFGSIRRQSRPRGLDLTTMRATVSYMHDDAVRTPGCERVAEAFSAVLGEIEAAERKSGAISSSGIVAACFVPFLRRRGDDYSV